MTKDAILILAAGQSRRMRGTDKMLELVAGQPLIRRQALVALATGLSVWIALPTDQPARYAELADLPIKPVLVPTAFLGISQSIKAGNVAIPADRGVLLWLADLPEIETPDLLSVLSAARMSPDAIIRATTSDGKPGHPIYFPPIFRHSLEGLSGDNGARDVLRQYEAETVFVPLPHNRALTDLDTPEAWAAWRELRPF